jgi:methylisocitrate lyase
MTAADHGRESTSTNALNAGERLRWLMDNGCVAAPGAFNGLVARAVKDAGFDACYLSGGANSAASGVPDVGLLSLEGFCRAIREISISSGLPVLADADTGFGDAEMTRRTVFDYHHAGAAGLHIEDQQFPKRCGHLDGKQLIPADHMAEKIKWAAQASQDCSGGSFIVCARTDAAGVESFDAAVDRAMSYVQAGAEMIFPEGLHSRDEFVRFAESMNQLGDARPYLLANMTEFGKTPMIPLSEFAQMGYDIVIFPVTTLRAAMGAVTRTLAHLHAHGTIEPLLGEFQDRQSLYGLLGYTPGEPWNYGR